MHGRLRILIAERVRADLQRPSPRLDNARTGPADLLAEYVASTFVVVLDWLDTRSPLSAASD